MLFFKRILRASPPADEPAERRGASRFAVGTRFPLKAVVNIPTRDDSGAIVRTARGGMDWGARVLDLSGTGARLAISRVAITAKADPCTLTLSLEQHRLVLNGKVAHAREERGALCLGTTLEFKNEATRQAYHQLLELVSLGATLRPAKAEVQAVEGYAAERYAGGNDSCLWVWRTTEPPGRPVAFEFRLKEWCVRGTSEASPLDYLVAGPTEEPRPAAGAQAAEIHRLFHWVVPNIGTTVPDDVRDFLGRFAA